MDQVVLKKKTMVAGWERCGWEQRSFVEFYYGFSHPTHRFTFGRPPTLVIAVSLYCHGYILLDPSFCV